MQDRKNWKKMAEKLAHRADFWKDLAHHDHLTGLYNKRYFDNIFARFLARLRGQDRRKSRIKALVLILCDVNQFKFINDNFGHQIGDQVLKIIAGVLENSVRTDDIVARVGGDEFGIILKVEEVKDALLAVKATKNRILQNLQDLKITEKELKLSVSIGYAILKKGQSKTSEQLFKKADKMMYKEKQRV